MQLERCSDQPNHTLDEFYEQIAGSKDPVNRACGAAMVELIARLRALPDQRKVWCLTSEERMCLLARDDATTPRHVVVVVLDRDRYVIEYLMPASAAPWPDAHVRGEARSQDDAVEMIGTAIERSQGWS